MASEAKTVSGRAGVQRRRGVLHQDAQGGLHLPARLEKARAVIGTFVERYNNGRLLQRHGYMTPASARENSAGGRPDV